MAKHILVIGDDPALLAQIGKILTAAGYIISTLTHATYRPEEARRAQAILVVVDRTPDKDITIWQTVQRMRLDRILMHLPLIICTDLEPDIRETNFYEERHIIFVQKPFEDSELLEAVNSTLRNLPARSEAPKNVRLSALARAAAKSAHLGVVYRALILPGYTLIIPPSVNGIQDLTIGCI